MTGGEGGGGVKTLKCQMVENAIHLLNSYRSLKQILFEYMLFIKLQLLLLCMQ